MIIKVQFPNLLLRISFVFKRWNMHVKFSFRNWFDKVKLCSVDVGRQLCSGLSFNPTNWRQLCTLSKDVLTLWNVGQLNRKYALMSRWVTSKFMVLSTSKLFLSSLLNIPFHFGAKLTLAWENSQHFVVKAHKFHSDKARKICFDQSEALP